MKTPKTKKFKIPSGWRRMRVGEPADANTCWISITEPTSLITPAWCAVVEKRKVLAGGRIPGYSSNAIFITKK